MKKLFPLLCALLLLASCGPALPPEDPGRLRIAAAVFPAYDFARAAAGDLADVTLLLPPGAESHSYEPTPADILQVQRCDLFLYLGGESDAWVDTILSAVERQGETLRMIDCVDLLEEESVDGMQGGHDHDHQDDHGHPGEVVGMDEHVWTAPRNAAAVTRTIGERLAALDNRVEALEKLLDEKREAARREQAQRDSAEARSRREIRDNRRGERYDPFTHAV